jgi:hypothetical protein
MIIRFYELSLSKIREKKAQHIERVASGAAQTLEDYRSLCGKIQGLGDAENILKELFDALDNKKIPR